MSMMQAAQRALAVWWPCQASPHQLAPARLSCLSLLVRSAGCLWLVLLQIFTDMQDPKYLELRAHARQNRARRSSPSAKFSITVAFCRCSVISVTVSLLWSLHCSVCSNVIIVMLSPVVQVRSIRPTIQDQEVYEYDLKSCNNA